MMPDSPAFGGGAMVTTLHPAVLVGLILVLVLMLVLPRKYVIGPVLMGVFLIPLGQQVYAFGVHWLVCRIIVLCGLLRVLVIKSTSKKYLFAGGFNRVDSAFIGCVICESIAVVLLYMQTPALTNQIAFLIDFLGAYCVLRVVIQDEADIYRALKWLGVITVILAIVMVREQVTRQNAFGMLGGIPLASEVRDGKVRSRAVFQHPLTAGAFGATLLPLFLLLWKERKSRLIAAGGLVGCTAMTLCSNSSTPLMAYFAGLFALCFWPLRRRLRTIRWALVILLISLHLVMKAPVWMLIARVDLTGSSSGYHRAQLVDQFIRHFGDWWMIGTKDTINWGEDIWDAQNEYVSVGETGGLLAFVLFIAMISRVCARIGNARKLCEDRSREWFVWFFGAALFSNLVAFFGVNYFDQSKVGWFALLAMISAATAPILAKRRIRQEPDPVAEPELALASGAASETFSPPDGEIGLIPYPYESPLQFSA